MDRRIQYFQDRTEYGSHDPLFPGTRILILIRGPYNINFRTELIEIQLKIISILIQNRLSMLQ